MRLASRPAPPCCARALRKLRREYPKDAYVFVSERGGPIFPPPHPAHRGGRQDAIPDPPTHASPCLWVQTRQRWPRYAGSAALPRAQEYPAHGQIHRHGARPVQGLLERLTLALGILVPPLPGAGKLGTTSASPSITLAFAAASRCAIISLMNSIARSICSVVIALTPPECSTCSSRGTRSAQIFI